jgi:phage gp45-like
LQKITNLLKYGKIVSVDDSGGSVQTAKITYMGKTQTVPLFMPYGVSANPPAGELSLILVLQGQEKKAIGIPINYNRKKTNQTPGTVTYQGGSDSSYLTFGGGGDIIIISDSVKIGEAGSARKLIDERLVPKYNLHTHASLGAPPTELLVLANVATENTEAS